MSAGAPLLRMVIIIAADKFAFSICFAGADDIGDDMIRYYWPLLPEKRKNEISVLPSADDRRLALACEVAARQALSGFSGVPEEKVRPVYSESGIIISGKGSEYLTVKSAGGIVCAAATNAPAGLGLAVVAPFDFSSAQRNLSDSEIRSLMAVSGCSLMDMVNSGSCTRSAATDFYAKLCALKLARNSCFSDKEKKPQSAIAFDYVSGEFVSRSSDCEVIYCGADKKYGFAAALVSKI